MQEISAAAIERHFSSLTDPRIQYKLKHNNKKTVLSELSWSEVFEDEYGLSSEYLQ